MPAPLAKGLLITLSLLCAAGLAASENPQVRQWIDESRRKVAIALHSLGDELAPDSDPRRDSREAFPDASTHEDEDPEAVERRRQARQEILERGRILEERRRSKQGTASKAKSFDELVDKDGALKAEETIATSTAAQPEVGESGLRHRHTQRVVPGCAFANPVTDEGAIDSPATLHEDSPSRSRSPTLPISHGFPPVPPKPAAYQPQRLLIDGDEVSSHTSEQLLDLTSTTSASSANADLAELSEDRHHSQLNFWSVNEWAQNSPPAAFYSPPRSEPAGIEERMEGVTVRSHSASGEHASLIGSEDLDMMSENGIRISTPGSWTEVGSQVSEG